MNSLVKELEWRDDGDLFFTGIPHVTGYTVQCIPKLAPAWYRGSYYLDDAPTLEAAKAACQADYERRILECLDLSAVEELVKAGQRALRFAEIIERSGPADGDNYVASEVTNALRKALSNMEVSDAQAEPGSD